MTLIAVGTWRGVGATTAAMLLAAASALNDETWLVEADPAGGVLQARSPVLAGGRSALEQLAFDNETTLESVARPFGSVHTLVGATDSFQAWSTLATPRFNWIERLRRVSGVVVVDVGSLRGAGLPTWRIIEQADSVVVCTTPEPASLVSSLAWMDAKGQSAPGVGGLSADTARMLVIDAPVTVGERFTPGQVTAELGERIVGWWPWQPGVIDAVLRGASVDHRRLRAQLLISAARATMTRLLQDAEQ